MSEGVNLRCGCEGNLYVDACDCKGVDHARVEVQGGR